MVPQWCSGVVPDLYQVVPEHGLGLVDAEVYGRMCGSMRNQELRIWSPRNGALHLLAAVLRAVEFQVDTHYEPSSAGRVDELRDSMLKTVASWSDEELSACVPGYDPKEATQEQYFMSAQGALLHLYHALYPATAPRIYVIIGDPAAHAQPSLPLVDGKEPPKPNNTRCIVLFQNMSTEPSPHVEVIGWKRGSRGPSLLQAVFDFSETIIQSLESWYLHHNTASRKRPREKARGTAKRHKRGRRSSPHRSIFQEEGALAS